MKKQLAAGTGLTIGATLAMGGVAQAACTCNVNSLADPTEGGHTTLRDAIISANANPGSTITFASGLSGTITLDGTQLPIITVPTTIAGPGPSQLAVDAHDASRVFYTNQITHGDPVTISGLTVKGGSPAGDGAGIYDAYADLTVNNTVVSGNHANATSNGGGIAVVGSGSLTIANCTISGNIADRWGGGIYTEQSQGIATTIRSSTISGNQANGGFGGGAYFDYTARATVENSTIYGNSATNGGGGFYHFGAPPGNPGLTVTGSTITHNTAHRGGGVASNDDTGYTQPTFQNTIVSGNTATVGPDLSAYASSMNAAFSLIGSPDPATTINQTVPGSDIFGQDPQLGPLAGNGGSTQTQKPAPSSPVVDKGSAFGLGTDQRGNGRPFDVPTIPNSSAPGADGSDIGAVELQASELPSNAFTLGVKGKKLLVGVSAPGGVSVSDAGAPLSATGAKKKKKRKLLLKASSATGGPPTISVPLRLSKLGKQKLRQKGKVTMSARVTFTPNYGIPSTRTAKLKIKGKGKRKK